MSPLIKLGSTLRRVGEERFSSLVLQNTLWALSGYALRLVIQAAYFIIMVRTLGPKQYGGFIAVTALAGLISPFVGMGSGNILIKNVARDRRRFAEYWGHGLLVTIVSGLGLLIFVIALCKAMLPASVPSRAVVLISVSDLIFVPLLEMAGWAFQAFEMIGKNARLNVLLSVLRLLGIAGLALTTAHPDIVAWSAVYLAGSALAAFMALAWVTVRLGPPKLAPRRMRGEWPEGFYFSVSSSAQTIYNDIDKTMLARLSTLDATGIYGAAYRLIDVSFLPVRALLNAAYPGFFRNGGNGIHASVRYGRRLLRGVMPYSIFVSVALVILAPVVPWILGREYAGVTEALRWLALLPVLKTLHYFTADSLTGAGYQGLRTLAQVGVAIFNVLINFWIIPAYGWRGAAWSSIASDGLLVLSLFVMAALLSCPARPGREQTATVAANSA